MEDRPAMDSAACIEVASSGAVPAPTGQTAVRDDCIGTWVTSSVQPAHITDEPRHLDDLEPHICENPSPDVLRIADLRLLHNKTAIMALVAGKIRFL
jgi:hypothetical protein